MGADVRWRASKRGLVLSSPHLDGAVLLDHPRAHDLPLLTAVSATSSDLAMALGEPNGPKLVEQLMGLGLVEEQGAPPRTVKTGKRFIVSRSGLEIAGIATLATWVNRFVSPVLVSRWMVPVYAAIFGCGLFFLARGEPSGPPVSPHPALDALVGVAIALTYSLVHELAHAAALVRYGGTPRRAGLGFYWGALSYFVDSTDALTLPKGQRIRQALVGLFCDAVAISVLATVAHATSSTFLAAVCWRVALIACLELVVNSLPILEVDGHIAVSDALDEPDLAPRSRAALGAYLRRRHDRAADRQPSLAAYGAVSLVGGLALLVTAGFIWWHAAGDLVSALFAGSTLDIMVGVYVLVPFSLGVIFSSVGLVLDLVPDSDQPDSDHQMERRGPPHVPR